MRQFDQDGIVCANEVMIVLWVVRLHRHNIPAEKLEDGRGCVAAKLG